jgi:hypothetical protein
MTASPPTEEGRPMRSLWRNLALQWLGGDASEALTGDSTVLESLPVGNTGQTTPVFDVQREPGVSHRAMLIPGDVGRTSPEYSAEEVLRATLPSDYLC